MSGEKVRVHQEAMRLNTEAMKAHRSFVVASNVCAAADALVDGDEQEFEAELEVTLAQSVGAAAHCVEVLHE